MAHRMRATGPPALRRHACASRMLCKKWQLCWRQWAPLVAMKVHAAAADGDDDDDDYNMDDDGDARGAFAGVGNDSLQTYEKSIELC